jgi:peptidoglycan/LPS O-acetylase OafA/YrhL
MRLAVLVAAMAMASAAWRSILWFQGANGTRLYFGTDTRADALLIGCALGVLFANHALARIPRTVAALGAAAGTVLLLFLVLTRDPDGRFMYALGGYTFAALSAGAILTWLVVSPAGAAARALSSGWLVWVGQVSYGLYLWHYPIAQVIHPADFAGLPRALIEVLRVACTLGAVTASFYLVERPALALKRRFRPASQGAP